MIKNIFSYGVVDDCEFWLILESLLGLNLKEGGVTCDYIQYKLE